MDDQALARLRAFYDGDVARRAGGDYPDWKREVRREFLDRLRAEGRARLLEIGAGTGRDSLFFQQLGLIVTGVDLSPAMVAACRAQGLDARVADMRHLDFPAASFDALYALNSLLHIPGAELPGVLARLHAVLAPGGLGFVGVYGGVEREGEIAQRPDQTPRFFAYHTDAALRAAVAPWFTEVAFAAIDVGEDEWHFQALTVRRRAL